jgi:putative phosphoesterase
MPRTRSADAAASVRVGLISDTHGLLRPSALDALAGSDHIVHAGDIGAPDILDALARIAPVTAVRGNNDVAPWARGVPERAVAALAGVSVLVLHDLADLGRDPARMGHRVVVYGHSHRPGHELRGGVHYVNPGSAGPQRFSLPIALARLEIRDGAIAVELVELAA